MKKSFYVIIFCCLCLSALMLGFSYAKESGTNQETFLNQEKGDNFRIIYSDEYLSTGDKDGTDISIINHGDKETDIVLVLSGKDEEEIKEDIYYSIDNGDIKKLTTSEIKLGKIKNYGIDGDHLTFNIKISSKSDEPIYLVANIKREDRKTFMDILANASGIYKDENGNIRYYGPTANNYINIDGVRYRMIGEFNGKLRLVTEVIEESNYETALNTGGLVTYDDYLRSFKGTMIEENEVKVNSSWLKEQQFWLQDSKDGRGYVASAKLGIYTDDNSKPHNNRYVKEVDSKCYYVSGDGTANSPYEVAYGS